MKLIYRILFFANLLLLAGFCKAQEKSSCIKTSFKNYKDTTGNYLIKYYYNSCMSMIPSIYPEGEPHYNANITVYKIVSCKCFLPKNDTIIIGKSFIGTYVENGCFEDIPEYNVKKAIRLKIESVNKN